MREKRWLLIALALLMALSIAACGTSGSAPSPAEPTPAAEDAAETPAALPEPDEHTRIIAAAPMSVELPEGFNAYDPEGNYTDEMCAAQGVEPENMAAYMSMAKKDLMLVPADEPYVDCSLEIYVRVKSDNEYGINSFNELSEAEFQQAAAALVTSFDVGGFEMLGSDTCEIAGVRYCVMDCKGIDYERRYATVMNGKMIYFVAVTDGGIVTDEQDAIVRQLLETVRFG